MVWGGRYELAAPILRHPVDYIVDGQASGFVTRGKGRSGDKMGGTRKGCRVLVANLALCTAILVSRLQIGASVGSFARMLPRTGVPSLSRRQ